MYRIQGCTFKYSLEKCYKVVVVIIIKLLALETQTISDEMLILLPGYWRNMVTSTFSGIILNGWLLCV